jgi:hypothetical protein
MWWLTYRRAGLSPQPRFRPRIAGLSTTPHIWGDDTWLIVKLQSLAYKAKPTRIA